MDFLGMAGIGHSVWGWMMARFMRREPTVQINLGPGAVYNDFRDAKGDVHIHFHGEGEIVAPRAVPVRLGTLTMGPPTISISATKVKATPPAASDDERPK